MFPYLRRSRLAQGTLAALLFVAVGYFSNALSTEACQKSTSRWLNEQLAQYPTTWPDRRALAQPAEYRFPWLVAVDYQWAVSPTGGEWGRRYYVSLFGLALPIRNRIIAQS